MMMGFKFGLDLELPMESLVDLISAGPAGMLGDTFDWLPSIGESATSMIYGNAAAEIMGGPGDLADRLQEVVDTFGTIPHADPVEFGVEVHVPIPGTGAEWVYSINDTGSGYWVADRAMVQAHAEMHYADGSWYLA